MNRLNHATWVAIFVLGGCGGSTPEPTSAAAAPQSAGTSQVSSAQFEAVLADAANRAPGTQPFEVEIESHDGRMVIEVEVAQGDAIRDLFYDPSDGHFVGEQPESVGDASSFGHLRSELGAGHASLSNALAAARRDHPGNLRQVEVQSRSSRLVVEVAVEGEGDSYLYDASTGALIGREAAGDSD